MRVKKNSYCNYPVGILLYVLIIFGFLLGCSRNDQNGAAQATSENHKEASESNKILKLSSVEEFDRVLGENDIVLADFYADWCGPCHMLRPKIEEISVEFSEKIKVVAIDIDQLHSLASRFKVNSIPDVKIFKNGTLEESFVGVQPKENYVKVLNKLIND